MYSRKWLVDAVCDRNITNTNPNPNLTLALNLTLGLGKPINQCMGIVLFVLHKVCFNHFLQEVVNSRTWFSKV